MDYLDIETLRKCQVYLVNELVLTDLLDELFEKGVFNRPMLDNIMVHARKSDQIRKLLSDLPKRGPTAFGTFLECLRETEQDHIAKRLETTRRSLGGAGTGAASLAQSHSTPNCAQQPPPAVNLPARPQSESALQTIPNDIYSIDRVNPASVLIINNRFYGSPVSSHGRLPPRDGTDADERELRSLFDIMPGFKTKVVYDIRGAELLPTVKEYFDLMVSSSLILIIMTHGHDGGILFGDDGVAVNIKEIIKVMQQYQDKPKMIIIQACRGRDPDEGLLTTDVSEVDAQPPDMEELAKKMEQMSVTAMTAINRVAELSDTFVFYSTVPGYASIRNKSAGTWFLQAFCTQVRLHHQATDLYTIAVLINEAVSLRNTTIRQRTATQVSQFVNSLKKRWYLLGFGQ